MTNLIAMVLGVIISFVFIYFLVPPDFQAGFFALSLMFAVKGLLM